MGEVCVCVCVSVCVCVLSVQRINYVGLFELFDFWKLHTKQAAIENQPP